MSGWGTRRWQCERERARRDEMRALARSALFLNSPPDIAEAALDFGFKKSAMPHAQHKGTLIYGGGLSPT